MSSTHTTNTQYIPIQWKRFGICIGMYWDFNTCQYAHKNFTNTHAKLSPIRTQKRPHRGLSSPALKFSRDGRYFIQTLNPLPVWVGRCRRVVRSSRCWPQTWWCRRRCRPIARAHLRLEFPAPQPRLEPARTGGPPHNGAFGRPSAGSGLSHPNSQPSESATRVVSRVGHYIILLLWMTMMLMMMMLAINRTTT